jgi:hypothetical protein
VLMQQPSGIHQVETSASAYHHGMAQLNTRRRMNRSVMVFACAYHGVSIALRRWLCLELCMAC